MGCLNFQERRPGNFFSGKLHIADGSEKRRRLGKRARRRRHGRSRDRTFEHGTADEVRYKILSRRKRHALFERKQHLEATEFFRFRDGIDTLKMKNRLPAMILAEPAGLQRYAAGLIFAVGVSDKHFAQSCQAFGKIGEEFGGNFALVAARPKDARNQDPAWSFRAQWEIRPPSGSWKS